MKKRVEYRGSNEISLHVCTIDVPFIAHKEKAHEHK